MLIAHRAVPDPRLSSVVRQFTQRQCASAHRHVPPFALPARTDQFIEFYLADVYRVSVGDDAPESVPTIAVETRIRSSTSVARCRLRAPRIPSMVRRDSWSD